MSSPVKQWRPFARWTATVPIAINNDNDSAGFLEFSRCELNSSLNLPSLEKSRCWNPEWRQNRGNETCVNLSRNPPYQHGDGPAFSVPFHDRGDPDFAHGL